MSFLHIRTISTARFHLVLDCDFDADYELDVQDDGNLCQETADKLNSGEWSAYLFRVRVLLDGREIASDYLGGSIYADPAEFEDHRQCGAETRKLRAEGQSGTVGSYFSDMVRTAISEARKTLCGAPRLRCA